MGLIFGAPKKMVIVCPDLMFEGFGVFGTFVVDVSIAETHTIQRTPTRFPIEDGSFISDHIQVAPRDLKVQAYLTDTPTDFVDAVSEAARNLQTAFAQTIGAPVTGKLASTRSKDMYRDLERLASRHVLCKVVTDLLIYQNMIMTRLSAPRTKADGRGLTVEMDFERLKIARTSTREALIVDVPTQPSPAPTKNVGKRTPKPVATIETGAHVLIGDELRSLAQ